ncbi:MAG: hypothetical protein WD972_02460, partial [Candidatus Andersenbacteria bacterium]
MTSSQRSYIADLVYHHNLSSVEADRLSASGLISDLAAAVKERNFTNVKRNEFRQLLGLPPLELIELSITLSENQKPEELISRGCYKHIDSGIRSLWIPCCSYGEWLLALLPPFKATVDRKAVLQAIARMGGYRAASAQKLLALGAHPEHRELLQQIPIVCLEDFLLDGKESFLQLDDFLGERRLELQLETRWPPHSRF